jgi:hypothetical protein
MSADDLHEFARKHGWRMVWRVGGHQIEFYHDAAVRMEDWQ